MYQEGETTEEDVSTVFRLLNNSVACLCKEILHRHRNKTT